MRSGMYDFASDTDFFNRYIADPTAAVVGG